jgi:hypothetical protein
MALRLFVESSENNMVPVIMPMTLAASLRVNSAFVRNVVPSCQLAFTCDCLQLGVLNQPDCRKKGYCHFA